MLSPRSYRSPSIRVSLSQRGAGLVEVMIGITIGLIIMAGVITMSAQTSKSGIDNVRITRLSQQIRQVMDHLTTEIQRAGYVELWDVASPPTSASALNVDAMTLVGDVRVFKFTTRGSATGTPTECTPNTDTDCDCVLFSYDLDKDGLQDVGSGTASANQEANDEFELYGFRWNDGAIQQKFGNTAGETVHACTTGSWQDITDSTVTITSFQLQHILPVDATEPNNPIEIDGNDNGTCEAGEVCLERRSVQVDITGQLVSDTSVELSVSNEIKVKNDYYHIAP